MERLLIAFGDTEGELGGVALAGCGLLLAAAGAVRADPAPVIVSRDDGGALLRAGGDVEIVLDPLGPPAPLGAGAAVV